ncbi:MAG: rane fusion protein multidrug efflux system [Acidobacteriota bacterium]|jgi:RND family efflux transporter MFP subunit|nr:rane fusion protein multidrug efflux system [Acidobacteriota bacterium]
MVCRWIAVSALLLTFAGCKGENSSASAQEGKREQAPKRVQTEIVQERQLGATVLVNGTLDAYDRATVGTKVAGRLQVMAVDLGSRVSRGQLIARVDPTDYNIRLQQAEAGLAQARVRLGLPPEGSSDSVDPGDTPPVREARAVLEEARASRERYQSLLSGGLISKADFDQVQSQARVAESRYQDAFEEIRNRQAVASQRRAEVALARQQAADTGIYASFDGVVQQRIASIGEFLSAGAPVAEIVKINPLRFRAEVPERDAATIRAGQTVQLAVDGAPHDYTGRVTRLSPTITERTRVLQIEADIPNDGALRAGSFARATIVTDTTASSLAVPQDALITFAGIEKVVVVEKGKTKEKPVTTGRRAGEWVEILSGVKAGDEVVLNPVNLKSGQSVVTR